MLLYYFYQYEVSITESTTTSNQPSLNESTHTDNVPISTNKPPLYVDVDPTCQRPFVPVPTNSVQYGTAIGHRNKVSYIQLVYILYCIIY